MRVYTITCHNVYNHGASLQEYALLHYLSLLGHDVATINYTPDYLSGHFNFFSVDNPKWRKNSITKALYVLLKFPSKLFAYSRKIKFDKFSNEYIKETQTKYKTNKDLIQDLPNADVYICGSDQIWNSLFQNGKDPAFYLNFVPDDKKKISYAASFAIDEIADNLKDFVKESVQRLDAISVRESSGKKILSNLGVKEVSHVLDPVFLLDKSKWDKMCGEKLSENYILVYDFDNNSIIKEIAFSLKRKKGWQIIALNRNIKYADKNYYLQGPQEFLSLIKHAKFVLTNSFHAVAFSLIFKKEFYVFNRATNINTRMRDLLASLGIENRLLIDSSFDLDNQIDYEVVSFKLGKFVAKSKSFLLNSIND